MWLNHIHPSLHLSSLAGRLRQFGRLSWRASSRTRASWVYVQCRRRFNETSSPAANGYAIYIIYRFTPGKVVSADESNKGNRSNESPINLPAYLPELTSVNPHNHRAGNRLLYFLSICANKYTRWLSMRVASLFSRSDR